MKKETTIKNFNKYFFKHIWFVITFNIKLIFIKILLQFRIKKQSVKWHF